MAVESDALELSMSELRVVASYAAEAAQDVLPLFAAAHPDDLRPRAAVDAAQAFARGAHRSNLQRSTSLQAHRAAKQARTPVARHAALAAGDAAAAAYLHPIPGPPRSGTSCAPLLMPPVRSSWTPTATQTLLSATSTWLAAGRRPVSSTCSCAIRPRSQGAHAWRRS